MNLQSWCVRREPVHKSFHKLLNHKGLSFAIQAFLVVKYGKPEINQNFGEKIVKRLHRYNSNGFGNPDLLFGVWLILFIIDNFIEKLIRYLLRLWRDGDGFLNLASLVANMVLDNHGVPNHWGLSINFFLELLLIDLFFDIAIPWLILGIKIYLVDLVLSILVKLVSFEDMLLQAFVKDEVLHVVTLVGHNECHWQKLDLRLFLLVFHLEA